MWRYRRLIPGKDSIPAKDRYYMCPFKWLQHVTANTRDDKCIKFKFQRYMGVAANSNIDGRINMCSDTTYFSNCTWWDSKNTCWNMYQEWRDKYVEV